MVIGFGDLHKGITIELDGAPYKVEDYYQQKMQQRAPTYHIKLRNLLTGQLLDRSFSGYGMKFDRADVENRNSQFLYEEEGLYHFMDSSSFDQYELDEAVVGDAVNYLTDQQEGEVVFWGERPIAVELPTTVNLAVTETPPGYKGDTASGSGKPATVETGLAVNVPMFINIGDKIKVDTRTGGYVERV
jgi:elongation factor P